MKSGVYGPVYVALNRTFGERLRKQVQHNIF